MELLAWGPWVMTEKAQARTDVLLFVRYVHGWNERIARVFPEHHVRVAFGQLTRLRWAWIFCR